MKAFIVDRYGSKDGVRAGCRLSKLVKFLGTILEMAPPFMRPISSSVSAAGIWATWTCRSRSTIRRLLKIPGRHEWNGIYLPDTDLLDSVCENEKDFLRLSEK